jgi:hypothetical protein
LRVTAIATCAPLVGGCEKVAVAEIAEGATGCRALMDGDPRIVAAAGEPAGEQGDHADGDAQ